MVITVLVGTFLKIKLILIEIIFLAVCSVTFRAILN